MKPVVLTAVKVAGQWSKTFHWVCSKCHRRGRPMLDSARAEASYRRHRDTFHPGV
jgi:hypothetical protein